MGTFVIDDFGRGNTKPKDLLNRWIFPLEKRIDFQTLPDGRKVQCPFDCLLVFSTNLEPRDLADEAFLRRIPYKLYVGDPLEDEFEMLVKVVAQKMQVSVDDRTIKYVIDKHYKLAKRPMRMCHPRDLLMQIKHLCEYERRQAVAGPKEWDRVIDNYFGY
jgi:Mg-chelatase subunit ChlI